MLVFAARSIEPMLVDWMQAFAIATALHTLRQNE